MSCLPTTYDELIEWAAYFGFNSPREVSCLPTDYDRHCCPGVAEVSIPHGKCPVCRPADDIYTQQLDIKFQFPTGSVLSADDEAASVETTQGFEFQFPTGSVLSADSPLGCSV